MTGLGRGFGYVRIGPNNHQMYLSLSLSLSLSPSLSYEVAVCILWAFEREECDFARHYRLYLADVLDDRAFRVMAMRHCVVVPL